METRWRTYLQESRWGPRYWSEFLHAWVYIDEWDNEFVYAHDVGKTDEGPFDVKVISWWSRWEGMRKWAPGYYAPYAIWGTGAN